MKPGLPRRADRPAIDPTDPFGEDPLERHAAAANLARLVGSATQPFVLAIDGAWGTGKTHFVLQWQRLLEAAGHCCFYFNAWQRDYATDPLIAFLGEMEGALTKRARLNDTAVAAALTSVKQKGAAVLRILGPVGLKAGMAAIGADAGREGIKALIEAAADGSAAALEKRIADYLSAQKTVEAFREKLTALARALGRADDAPHPMVFIVDELDRCRPTFALELLERIKHVFDAEGMVFVLAIHRAQLAQAVAGAYGANLDGDAYLDRFIDLTFRMPVPPRKSFVEWLAEHWELESRFDQVGICWGFSDLVETAASMSDLFGLELREIERRFTVLDILIRSVPDDERYWPTFWNNAVLWTTLVFLEGRRPDLFDGYATGSLAGHEVVQALQSIPAWDAVSTANHRLRAALIAFGDGNADIERELSRARQIALVPPPGARTRNVISARDLLEDALKSGGFSGFREWVAGFIRHTNGDYT